MMKTQRVLSLVAFGLALAPGAFAADEKKPLEWAGDLRFRTEFVTNRNAAVIQTNQQRIRARIGAKAALTDDIAVEARLASGTGGTSTNQTLGAGVNAFKNYGVGIDRFGFKAKVLEGTALSAGRIANPFYAALGNDLVWDSDVNFDGMALNYDRSLGPVTAFVNAGFFWVDKAAARDVTLASGQLGVKGVASDDLKWSAGAAIHGYGNLQGHAFLNAGSTAASGNTGAAAYANDFRLIEAGADIWFLVGGTPFTVGGDFVTNTAAAADKTGFLAGVKAGKNKEGGDWSASYDYRELQRDSAVAAFTDADASNGGTNIRSHRVTFMYSVSSNFVSGLTGYFGDINIAAGQTARAYSKLQLDFAASF